MEPGKDNVGCIQRICHCLSIAAAVIGGRSLVGRHGSVASSFFGVLIIAALTAGLAQIGAQESTYLGRRNGVFSTVAAVFSILVNVR